MNIKKNLKKVRDFKKLDACSLLKNWYFKKSKELKKDENIVIIKKEDKIKTKDLSLNINNFILNEKKPIIIIKKVLRLIAELPNAITIGKI